MGQLVSTPDSPKTLTLPIGAASPLWLAFAGAASAGVAYWWMTRWARSPRVETAPTIALETSIPLAPAVEALELEKVIVEAPVKIAEPVATPVEVLAAVEPAPSASVEAPMIEKTIAKSPKLAAAAPAKMAASAPVVAKAAPKPKPVKAPKVLVAEVKAEPAASKPKPATRKPAIKRSVKTA